VAVHNEAKGRRILITGATGAIGSALAGLYAAEGATLFLHGRNVDLLESLAASCRTAGAEVFAHACDVRDRTAALGPDGLRVRCPGCGGSGDWHEH
jgi:NADP-dependent 3-hydroxy acid dehydrogenase YdfG